MDKFMSLVVIGGVVAVMLQCIAAQTAYLVGDSLGWDIPPNGAAAAYTTWASNKSFMVGDILMFNFTSKQHDVQQVPKDSYDACSSANPIGNAITTGPANITLNSAGDNYFICTFSSHCRLGQKLHVTVGGGTPGAAPPSTNTPTTPATPSPTSSTPEACAPTPSSTPKTDGPAPSPTPESVPPPPPGSSSSAVFASFFVTFLAIAMGFLI